MNISEYQNLYVFVEHHEGRIHEASLELIGEAKRLKADRPVLGYEVRSVILGPISDEMVKLLGEMGSDRIINLYHKDLSVYSTEIYTTLLYDLISSDRPDIFLIPATVLGRDLAPRLAARCDTGLTADATSLEYDTVNMESSLLLVTRPAFGGNLFGTIINETRRPQMTTIRPGVMDKASRDPLHHYEVEKRSVSIAHIEDAVKILKVLPKNRMAVDIAKADILISGGRGVGSRFDLLKDCAQMIGAEVAGSRAAVDEGRIDKECQVGQTGKSVKPKVYIACGISGAVQHLAGMEKSDYIIAINKDPDAPIFSIANMGIVGDAMEILPQLTETIRQYRERP